MDNDDFISRKRRNRIFGTIVTAVILIVLAVFFFGYLLRTEDPRLQKGVIGEVLESSGEVQIVRNFKNVACEPDLIVISGDFFRTRADGSAKVRYYDDGTEVTIGSNSNLIFNAIDSGKCMNLGKGIMTVSTPDQEADKPMVIVTHSSEATLIEEGAFTFSFIGLDATLSVQKGNLRFRRFTDGKVVDLAAGQAHTFKPAGPDKIEFEM